MKPNDKLERAFKALTPEKQAEVIAASTPAEAAMLSKLLETSNRQYATPEDLLTAIYDGFVRRAHLTYLSQRLSVAMHSVEQGRSARIAVSMPPRAGKSTVISTGLPIWSLARHPTWKVGLISHSPNLAVSWGRQVRRYVNENPDLGIAVAQDAGSVTDWQTTRYGGVTSRSVGQSVVGLGFKVLVLDDLVKDYAAAHSASAREDVWNWYIADARTRIEAPALVAAVGTRWHEDDFIGRLLSPEYAGDPASWEVIKLPAIALDDDVLGREPGQPLVIPLMRGMNAQAVVEYWAEIRADVGGYVFDALYQQEPAPAKGTVFDTDTFLYYSRADLPAAFDRQVTTWDFTFKGTERSDFVVGQLWGEKDGITYLLDQIRGRWGFNETLSKMKAYTIGTDAAPALWREASMHYVEDKANGPAIIDAIKAQLPGLKAVDPEGDKIARARAVTPVFEAGKARFPSPTEVPWVQGLVSELKAFPSGKNDDQVDALSQYLRKFKARVAGRSSVVTTWLGRQLSQNAAERSGARTRRDGRLPTAW